MDWNTTKWLITKHGLMGPKQLRKLLGYGIICYDQITFQFKGTGSTRLEIQSKEAGLGGDGRWQEPTNLEPGSNKEKGKLGAGTGGSAGRRHSGSRHLMSLLQALFGP